MASDHLVVAEKKAAGRRTATRRNTPSDIATFLKLTSQDLDEAAVLHEVRRFMANHPKCACVIRINSGATKTDDGRFIRFCEIEGQRQLRNAMKLSAAIAEKVMKEMKLVPDLIGFTTSGRFFAVECKRGNWKHPTTPREKAQANFLEQLNAHDGIGGFCTSLSDARKLAERF